MKYILTFLLFFTYSFSDDKIITKYYVQFNVVGDFDELLYSLKDEMIGNGFTLSFQSNLGKSINAMSKHLKKDKIFFNAQKIGFCKNSLGFKLVEENEKNILYCPIDIIIYEKTKGNITIIYELAKKLDENDTVVYQLNNTILKHIENILDE
jgi:uncharacterized protein (DUF302 family)